MSLDAKLDCSKYQSVPGKVVVAVGEVHRNHGRYMVAALALKQENCLADNTKMMPLLAVASNLYLCFTDIAK